MGLLSRVVRSFKGPSPEEKLRDVRARAEQGQPDAQHNLGKINYYGKGVPEDWAEAYKWYLLAAKQGHADSQYDVGYLHFLGNGCDLDNKTAFKWFKLAGKQGHADAQHFLGFMYKNGSGIAQDYEAAIKWTLRSANQGNCQGQVQLGEMYEEGEGVPKDLAEAHKWYLLAAEQGHADSQKDLDRVERKLKTVQERALPTPDNDLIIAVQEENAEAVHRILVGGLNPNAKDKALAIAERKNRTDIIDDLLAHGAKRSTVSHLDELEEELGEDKIVALNSHFAIISLFEKKGSEPMRLDYGVLGCAANGNYPDPSMTPIIVFVSEDPEGEPKSICKSVFSTISDIEIYNQTEVIFQALPCPVSSFEINEGSIDVVGLLLAHASIMPVVALRDLPKSATVHSFPSQYWTRALHSGANCYVYECTVEGRRKPGAQHSLGRIYEEGEKVGKRAKQSKSKSSSRIGSSKNRLDSLARKCAACGAPVAKGKLSCSKCGCGRITTI